MKHKEKLSPKICLTAGGCLIHKGKVLLVKHKKLAIWLNPGGHLEENEMPHQAAEREFWEETGLKVKAYDPWEEFSDKNTEFLPRPISSNLHWVCRENYENRKSGSNRKLPQWKRGCEMHHGQTFLVKSVSGYDFYENVEETDGIAWFSEAEVKKLKTIDILDNIVQEITLAFRLVSS